MRDNENKHYLEPDYSGHPTEDDDDIPMDEDEARLEKILDEELRKEEEKEKMSNNPFAGSGSWGNSGSTPSSQKAPWEQQTQQPSQPSWNKPSWGSGSSWGGGSWGSNNGNSQPAEVKPQGEGSALATRKRVVICDVLDCLYEPWDCGGKPDRLPKGVFDLMPKFAVWDKIMAFSPLKLYIIFPPAELIPSFGNRASTDVALEYVAHSVSAYLRMPRENCQVLKQMRQGTPKEKLLASAVQDWMRYGSQEDMVYIGIHSGRWNLSGRDLEASRNVGINYIDVYNLIDGKYILE